MGEEVRKRGGMAVVLACLAFVWAGSPLADEALAEPYLAMTVTPEGLGPIHPGMTLAQVSNILGVDATGGKYSYGGDECGSYYLGRGGEYGSIRLLTRGDVVAVIDIFVPQIRTQEGFGQGSAIADIVRHFGASATKRIGHYLDTEVVVTLEGTANKYLFIGSGAVVDAFRVGREPELHAIEGCL